MVLRSFLGPPYLLAAQWSSMMRDVLEPESGIKAKKIIYEVCDEYEGVKYTQNIELIYVIRLYEENG